jgi:hypothetical protein
MAADQARVDALAASELQYRRILLKNYTRWGEGRRCSLRMHCRRGCSAS